MSLFDKMFKRKKQDNSLFYKVFSSPSNQILGRDSTSFAAIDLICSAFASLTGSFFDTDTKQAIKDHYLYDVIHSPNADETKFQFFYNSAKDYFNGNVYWYLYDLDGEIISLFRLNPNVVRVKRDINNQKIFCYSGQEYDSRKILHIPSRYGYDGLIGRSVFSECNKIFSNTLELDDYVNNSFSSSIGNRLIIDITKEYPNASDEQILQLQNMFLQNYTGIKNAGKPIIKSGKLDYDKIETAYKDNKANQLVENREFQEREVAKLFGVPLPLLNGKETTNIESLYIVFIENAIKPLATSFEQAINKMIPYEERRFIYYEYSYSSLQKTNLQTRIESYTKELMAGILSPNEIRRKENLPEIEAGDNHFVPANLLPLKDSVIDSYMASAKLKAQQLNEESPNTNGNHSNLGDDKI
jgi:HK97 family phage portal protein